MGGGGYVAGPVGLAALTLRIPLVLTEADSRLGLTNRMLAPVRAARVPGVPARREPRRRRRATAVDRPAGPGAPCQRPPRRARERLGIPPDETCVLVFGGSLGARSINMAALEAFSGATFRVLHVSGRRDYAELAERELPRATTCASTSTCSNFADALAAADLVVARAGGSVLRDRRARPARDPRALPARLRRPSERERALDGRGGRGDRDPRRELTAPRLAREVAALLADRPPTGGDGVRLRRLARPEAAAEVAAELLAGGRR